MLEGADDIFWWQRPQDFSAELPVEMSAPGLKEKTTIFWPIAHGAIPLPLKTLNLPVVMRSGEKTQVLTEMPKEASSLYAKNCLGPLFDASKGVILRLRQPWPLPTLLTFCAAAALGVFLASMALNRRISWLAGMGMMGLAFFLPGPRHSLKTFAGSFEYTLSLQESPDACWVDTGFGKKYLKISKDSGDRDRGFSDRRDELTADPVLSYRGTWGDTWELPWKASSAGSTRPGIEDNHP